MTSLSTGVNVSATRSSEEIAPESSHAIFIGNIPTSADRRTLLAYLHGICRPKHVSMPTDVRTGRHKGFAKAFFRSEEETSQVLGLMSQHYLLEVPNIFQRWVPRRFFVSKKEKPSVNKVFFRMVHLFEYRELLDLFSSFGQVIQLDLKKDHLTYEARNYGFVTFFRTLKPPNH